MCKKKEKLGSQSYLFLYIYIYFLTPEIFNKVKLKFFYILRKEVEKEEVGRTTHH